jgi:hypothetical protein
VKTIKYSENQIKNQVNSFPLSLKNSLTFEWERLSSITYVG